MFVVIGVTNSFGAVAPLGGIVVAGFSRVLAGPLATMTLGDPVAVWSQCSDRGVGDETRSWRPPTTEDGQPTYYLAVNRNTRSIALDLSTSEGCLAAKTLVRGADARRVP
jgi:crotonobetainyl-CoA:carnitine CoA-transferase CaiB-like acyl-CoA transferase